MNLHAAATAGTAVEHFFKCGLASIGTANPHHVRSRNGKKSHRLRQRPIEPRREPPCCMRAKAGLSNIVYQVFRTTTGIRTRHSLHATTNDALADELFAMD